MVIPVRVKHVFHRLVLSSDKCVGNDSMSGVETSQ